MFGMADLITVAVINDGLKHFAKNPFHLEFVLGAFCSEPIRSMVGPEHIKQCVEFISNNRIQVAPYYQLDTKHRPAIGVISQGRENQQFLGDYGAMSGDGDQRYTLPPRVYAQFNATSITDDRQGLVVSREYGLDQKLWPGVILTNGFQTNRISGILVRDGHPTTICLNDKLPEGASLAGWRAQSQERARGVVAAASMDDVTIQLTLTTHGDPSVHRLLAVVVRACLKRGRLMFDMYGLQKATYSYTPPIVSDQAELEMESQFTIEAIYTDLWVDKEFDLNDSASNILVEATLSQGGREDVILD